MTGISLDISGAILVLGAILRARPTEVAEEALTYIGFSAARLRARTEERRYARSGAFLLVVGFALQLVGYAWTFSSWWMLAYAAALALLAALVAPRIATVGSKFHERAEEMARKAAE